MVYVPLITIGILIKQMPTTDRGSAEKLAEMVVAVLGLIVIPVLNAAVLHLAHADRENRSLGAWTALRSGLSCWFPLVVGYIAISLVVMGWLIVGVLPGLLLLKILGLEQTYYLLPFGLPAVYMAARYGFMETLIVVRGRDPYAARQESMRLSKGNHVAMFVAGILLIGLPLLLEQFAPVIAEQLAAPGLPVLVTGGVVEFVAGILNLIYLIFFFHWYSLLEQQRDAK